MINAQQISEYEREYAVLGSTGNVYQITIGTLHHCTCPDFAKGNLCKHVMFVLLKVLRVDSNSKYVMHLPLTVYVYKQRNAICCDRYVYQKALLTTELAQIFEAAPQTLFDSEVVATAAVRKKYKKITGNGDDDGDEVTVERKALAGNDCPVCMEELDDKEPTTWCRAVCGQNVHVECFREWRRAAERKGEDVVCMFCRSEWIDGPEDGAKGKKKLRKKKGSGYNEGYMNFASEQGMSTQRDTSDYYANGWNGYGRRSYGYRRGWW